MIPWVSYHIKILPWIAVCLIILLLHYHPVLQCVISYYYYIIPLYCSVSYLKCCETLSFLVRDVVHITPENFSSCVAAIRTFVEASYK